MPGRGRPTATVAPGGVFPGKPMEFVLTTIIDRPVAEVYTFFRDVHLVQQEPGSPVLLIEKTTPGEVAVGSQYRELLRMLPFWQGEILSEVTRLEPDRVLAYRWRGPGMSGELEYHFQASQRATEVLQRQTVVPGPALRPLGPLIRMSFNQAITRRLVGIKLHLENSPSPVSPLAAK